MKKLGILIFVFGVLYLQKYSYLHVDIDKFKKDTITVEIKGEVIHPDLYELPYDATLKELLKKCGGVKEKADISAFNLAMDLHDKDVIVIPAKKEKSKVSLNSASKEELMTLTGIGPSTADKIIAYRKENGSFKRIEEIMNVKGIKEKSFAKIKDDICL